MYLLFDIGGTHMRLALSDGVHVSQKQVIQTPEMYAQGLDMFIATTKELLGEQIPDAIAGGFAAPINQNTGMIGYATNLEDWSHRAFAQDLQEQFNTAILLENDAQLAGIGEATHGAGADYDIVAYLTFGTGVGGTRIINKKIDKHAQGFEPGYMIVDFENERTWGWYAGGNNIRERLNTHIESLDSDKVRELERWIAYGIHNIIVLWSPDVVILGGGTINHSVVDVHNIQTHVKNIMEVFDTVPLILSSNLGDDSGLYGAMYLANKHI